MPLPLAAALPPAIKQGATAHLAAMMSPPAPAPAAKVLGRRSWPIRELTVARPTAGGGEAETKGVQ